MTKKVVEAIVARVTKDFETSAKTELAYSWNNMTKKTKKSVLAALKKSGFDVVDNGNKFTVMEATVDIDEIIEVDNLADDEPNTVDGW